MRQVTVAEWVWALRSGFYTQIRGAYKYRGGHCGLGVLWDLSGIDANMPNHENLRGLHRSFLSDSPQPLDVVISMNDGYYKSFSEIADWIEANVKDQLGKPTWTPPTNPEDGVRVVEEVFQEIKK